MANSSLNLVASSVVSYISNFRSPHENIRNERIMKMAKTPEDILRMEQDVVLTLKNIYDPEIPVNIYDLGLIYEIDVEPDGSVTIRMTLTAPNCPMADQLVQEVNDEVAKVKGVTSVNVILTFDPPWDRSMISEETLLELGLL